MSRRYGLIRPCPKCPFRTDVGPYLRPERTTEIATSIQQGGAFACHETTVYEETDDDSGFGEMVDGPDSKVCAGSLIVMEKMGQPNQDARIAERQGFYDPTRLDMGAPVVDSFVDWQQRHLTEEEQERETCAVVGPDCEAPAGYSAGGGVVINTETWAENECSGCGQQVCDACLTESGNCLDCEEDRS